MIMEDDAVPARNFTSNLVATADQLPEDWDVLRMLGCNDDPHSNSSWVDHRLRVHRHGGRLPELEYRCTACTRVCHCMFDAGGVALRDCIDIPGD